MKEYIEREALQNSLQRKQAGVANQRYTEGWNDCMMRVKSMVSTAKTADVDEVVRCKNCHHADYIGVVLYCCHWNRNVDDDGYCYEGW